MNTSENSTVIIVGGDAPGYSVVDITAEFSVSHEVFRASGAEEAAFTARRRRVEAVVCVSGAASEVTDMIAELRARPELRDIPIVAAVPDGASAQAALESGAARAVAPLLAENGNTAAGTPDNTRRLLRDTERVIEFTRGIRAREGDRWRDIFERASRIDQRTGLPNKQAFCRETAELIRQNPGRKYVLARGDIDRFKVYNDTFGTDAGDRLLSEIGRLLSAQMKLERAPQTVCHYESDHFAACWEDDKFDPDALCAFLNETARKISPEYNLTISCGLYHIDGTTTDVGLMCDRALLALRSVKTRYDRRLAWYDETMRTRIVEEQEIASVMKQALSDGEFIPYFQPQYNYETGRLIGAEALARWNRPGIGLISPAMFIPVFEKNGFIFEMDCALWRHVCADIRKWLDSGLNVPPISVNVSRRDMYNRNLAGIIEAIMSEYSIDHSLLRFEITESVFVDDKELLLETVRSLKERGLEVEMDDFGSGYSSLNTLKDVPVDLLKMDMAFVSDEALDGRGGAILSSVIRMAHTINMPVIAEGVERREQAEYLKSIGCVYMQGYFFARPMKIEDFEDILADPSIQYRTDARFSSINGSTADFLDASAQNTLLFNSFLGGAGIFECSRGAVSAIRLNDSFFNVIGMSRADASGTEFDPMDKFNAGGRAAFIAMCEKAAAFDCEAACEVCSADGMHWIACRARRIAEKVELHILYVSVEDITERIRLADYNRELSERLSAMINSVPGGVLNYIVTRNSITTTYRNEGGDRLFGSQQNQTPGGGIDAALMRVHPDDRRTIKKLIEAEFSGKSTPDSIRFRISVGDGWRWVQMNSCVVSRGEDSMSVSAVVLDIEDQLQNERMNEFYRNAILNLPVGIAVIESGDEKNVLYMNERAYSMFGYTDEEYRRRIAAKKTDCFHVGEEMLSPDIYKKLESGETVQLPRVLAKKKDGSPVWVSVIIHAGREQDKQLVYYITIINISRRVAAEDKANEQNRSLNALMDAVPGGIYKYALEDGKFGFVSGTLLTMLGYTREEFDAKFGGRFENMIWSDDRAAALEKIRGGIERAEAAESCEYRVETNDGSLKWLYATNRLLRDESGRSWIIAVVIDHDERRALEERLESDRQKIDSLLNSIPGGIASYEVCGRRLRLVYASEGIYALNGLTPEQYRKLVDSGEGEEVYPSDRKRVYDEIEAAVVSGAEIDINYRVQRPDGEIIWINMRGIRIGLKEGRPLLQAVFRNLTATSELYKRIVDETDNAIAVIDRETSEILFVNKAAERFFGAETDPVGMKCYKYLRGADSVCADCRALALGDESVEADCEMNGKYYLTRYTKIDWNGRDAVIYIMIDRTDAGKLAKMKDEAVRNIPGGIATFAIADGEVKREYLSGGAGDILGYGPGRDAGGIC